MRCPPGGARVRLRWAVAVRWARASRSAGDRRPRTGAGGPGRCPRDGVDTVTSTPGAVFGFASGLIIQEFGYDDDVDEALRSAVTAETGTGLVDEDYEDVADSAIVWWREDDGDVDALTDLLVDAQANLDGDGLIWVLTPKARTAGAVDAFEVEEAARTAGMHATSAAAMGSSWAGTRVVSKRH